jgi:hypothetical protein
VHEIFHAIYEVDARCSMRAVCLEYCTKYKAVAVNWFMPLVLHIQHELRHRALAIAAWEQVLRASVGNIIAYLAQSENRTYQGRDREARPGNELVIDSK